MKLLNYAILAFAVSLSSAVQLLVKYRLNVGHGRVPLYFPEVMNFVFGVLRDPWLWLAGIMLVSAAFMWYFVISRISLGVAFAFAALSFPIVMIGARLFLGEVFIWPQYAGCAMIVSGLFLIAAYA